MEHILACPKCSGANRWGQLSCRFCGENLAHKCANCNIDIDPAMKICPYCGETAADWPIIQRGAREERLASPGSALKRI